jgi:hypothetical protein
MEVFRLFHQAPERAVVEGIRHRFSCSLSIGKSIPFWPVFAGLASLDRL